VRFVFAALVLAVAPADAQTPDQWASARDTIRQVMARQNLPSVTVAVAKGGKILWEEGFGWADREKMLRATPNTLYSLASISKPYTATAMMTLVEQHRVDLDRPANDYLGPTKLIGLAGDASGATVRRVMSHTAGLPTHYDFFFANQPYPRLSNDEAIARYGILVSPPGEVYEYSNLGYGIIDHIIGRTSGMDYADFMRANVFVPLGLTHTSVGIGEGLEEFIAQRYDLKNKPLPFFDFDHRGASAIYGSAHYLVRFAMFHLKDHLRDQKQILSDATIDSMQMPVAPGNYGLGWITGGAGATRTFYHSGGMNGVATLFVMYPADDAAIVVLSNFFGADVGRVEREIERILVPKYAEARRAAARPPVASSKFAAPNELIGEWSGTVRTWERTIPLTLVVQTDGDIHVRLANQRETLLNEAHWEGNNLVGTFSGTIPTTDASRWQHEIVLSLRLRNGGSLLNGFAAAITTTEPAYFGLSSYASLTRKGAER
jgi:CubicO group peptidase (beta-lactamase class C family)